MYGLIEKIVDEKIARLRVSLAELPTTLAGVFAPFVHTHATLPSADEKDALAGTDGTPSAANPYVTDSDSRLFGSGSPEGSGDLVLIETQNPSGTGVVTFSSLGAYTHLRILYSARGDQVATSTAINLTFNGDSSAIYDREQLSANSTTAAAGESLAQTSVNIGTISASTAASGNAGIGEIVVLDYRGTAFHKNALATNGYKTSNAAANFTYRTQTVSYRSTSAITSIDLTLASGNYVAGSKFSLYGMN